jgi:Reverse transcriptase (RNA-dependent DNA polymerase)
MDQPEGYVEKGQEHKVCRLKKALYGLKQAGRQWYKQLCTSMRFWGFLEFIAGDIAIFTKVDANGDTTIILVYVDDMATFASSHQLLVDFKAQIATEYKFSDLGDLLHFLGLRITWDRVARTITLDQTHYIDKMLKRFEMQDTHLKKTLFASPTKPVASESPQTNPTLQ